MLPDKMIVAKAVESGLAATCAWCERFWETTEKMDGMSGCRVKGCGGPASRMAFPKYKGPWSPKEKYCFLCGRTADAMVDIGGRGAIGVCDDHIPKLKQILNSGGSKVVIKEGGKVPLFDR